MDRPDEFNKIESTQLRERIAQLQAIRNRLDEPLQLDHARIDLDALLTIERKKFRRSERYRQEALVTSWEEGWPDPKQMPPAMFQIYTDAKAAIAVLQREDDEGDDSAESGI